MIVSAFVVHFACSPLHLHLWMLFVLRVIVMVMRWLELWEKEEGRRGA
jgi:hypothetical protein